MVGEVITQLHRLATAMACPDCDRTRRRERAKTPAARRPQLRGAVQDVTARLGSVHFGRTKWQVYPFGLRSR